MLKSAVKVRIYRPLDEVFGYVSNPLNDVEWNAELRDVRNLPSRTLQVGDQYDMVFQNAAADGDGVILTQEVTAFEENVTFAFKTVAGSEIPITGTYTFAGAEVGATIQYVVTYDLGEAYNERVQKDLKREINKRLEINFTQLKTLLDTRSG